MFYLNLIFLISFNLYASCPEGTDLVNVDLSQFEKQISFCQKLVNGIPIKHGPLKQFKKGQAEPTEEFYFEDKQVTKEKYFELADLNKPKENSDFKNDSLEAHKAISSIFQSLTRVMQKAINQDGFHYNGCENYLRKWINVLLADTSYEFKYTFKDNCDINGSFETTTGKKLNGNIQLRNLGIFNHLTFNANYKLGNLNDMSVNLEIKDGILNSPKGKIIFDFNGKIYFNQRNSESSSNEEKSLITFTNIFNNKVFIQKPFYNLIENR